MIVLWKDLKNYLMKDDKINGYELSRDWFDFCFENTDLVTPTHTALYFFGIEHCNRLGWKEKFGLPTQMSMDAIGVKNWRTFSKAFNDLVNWGFFKLITKSRNQYSATVIAIVKNTTPNTKALTKAMQKHVQKQSNSIAVIDKLNNQITIEPINHTWRNNFEIYKSEMYSVFEAIKNDQKFIIEQERFNPNVDIILSIEKSISNYWGLESGWKNKKKSKTEKIDWISTFKNAISLSANKVYKSRNSTDNKSIRGSGGSNGKLAI